MIVCIAEKPSVAKDIARILGANKACNGYMEGNNYQVTWTFGHLCELKEPNDYFTNWKYWSLAALPMIPPRFGIKLIEDEGIKKQFAVIEQLYQSAEMIINCGDAGQEGELIQRWVMQKAGVKCPVKRLWISAMTDEAIREGFANLKEQEQYQPLYLAGLSRAIGDWLLGMNATRLYTVKYGNNSYGRGQVLSIGRVQTPTLALIVQRQKEIDNFKPEPYWVLATVYRDTQFTATKGKFTSKEDGEKAFSTIEGKPFTITSVAKKKGAEQPKQLYDLTSLQVDCNRKFGFSAEMTLNTIQTLYERKLTTYPRVDTQFLSDDIYPKCPQIMNGLFQTTFAGKKPYANIVKTLGGKPLPKTKRVFDSSKVTDHHAIIPTANTRSINLSIDEQRIYELIARQYLLQFCPDAEYRKSKITLSIEGGTFVAQARNLQTAGWKELLGKEDEDENQEPLLPIVKKGQILYCERGEVVSKKTQPPKPFTDATLLSAMKGIARFVQDKELKKILRETDGLGTEATRAGIIELLFKRGFLTKKGRNIHSTETGRILISALPDIATQPDMTAHWEAQLTDISQKQATYQQFMFTLNQMLPDLVRFVDFTALRRLSQISKGLNAAPAKRKRAVKKLEDLNAEN